MKRLLQICLIVALASVPAKAQTKAENAVAGGIVYSDGKNAIYYDYTTKAEQNLTADLEFAKITGPLAVSEDGRLLVWFYINKFYARRLPNGKIMPDISLKSRRLVEEYKNIKISPLLPAFKNARNITVSPDGAMISWESTEEEQSWHFVDFSKKVTGAKNYPMYMKRFKEYNAITVVRVGEIGIWRYGNVVVYPPTFPIITAGESSAMRMEGSIGPSMLSYLSLPHITGELDATPEEAHKMFSVKRDAHFFAWQKPNGQQPVRFALIYKTDANWPAIEIREIGLIDKKGVDIDKERLSVQRVNTTAGIFLPPAFKKIKPGFWQIPANLPDCQGLAWKPDGSLTCLYDGNVYEFKASQIKDGVEKSSIGVYKEVFSGGIEILDARTGIGRSRPNWAATSIIAVNNVLNINPAIIARGIDGDKPHWADNDTLLFRGKDGYIHAWREKGAQILCPAPEEFSYCDKPIDSTSLTQATP